MTIRSFLADPHDTMIAVKNRTFYGTVYCPATSIPRYAEVPLMDSEGGAVQLRLQLYGEALNSRLRVVRPCTGAVHMQRTVCPLVCMQ